jgi:hypothetical protein
MVFGNVTPWYLVNKMPLLFVVPKSRMADSSLMQKVPSQRRYQSTELDRLTFRTTESPIKIIGREGLDAQSEEIYTPSTTSKSAVGLTQCHITWLAVVCV